jgi:hypothetical protein
VAARRHGGSVVPRAGWENRPAAVAGARGASLLGSHERYMHCDRASTCGAGLERELWTAGGPVPIPEPAMLGVALSGAGLHGSSGCRDGKNQRGGTLAALGATLLPSRPDEHQREMKSVTAGERRG